MSVLDFFLLALVMIGFAFIYLIEACLTDFFAYIKKIITKLKSK